MSSGNLIILRSNVKVLIHKKTLPAWVVALLWVLASSSWKFIFIKPKCDILYVLAVCRCSFQASHVTVWWSEQIVLKVVKSVIVVVAGTAQMSVMLWQVASHLMVGLCPPSASAAQPTSKVKRTVVTRVCDAVKAIAVCHNVTPVFEAGSDTSESSEQSDTEVDQQSQQRVSYQASSPDEVNENFFKIFFIFRSCVMC